MNDPVPTSFADIEARLLARRAGPPDAAAAAEAAMRCALGAAASSPTLAPMLRAAIAVGEAVERHGAAFPPGAEPAYHDRHHQAEAALGMGWLTAAAREAGLITVDQAGLGTLAMIGHDLLHDGSEAGPPGRLERQSADEVAQLATAQGLAAADVAELHRLILGTEFARTPEPGTLLALAREADLLGSLCPTLGWRLSQALAAERRADGDVQADRVASFSGRLGFLGVVPPPTPVGRMLGLAESRAAQIEAFTRAAADAGLPAATPAAAAAALDTLPRDAARALYVSALAVLTAGRPAP
ncbi:hypothetical protein [Plastoroseomonas arctica]|uniref:Uncharacterized protein n=1 Tax=Plastoroseomonas arctica TaxID=1509237 RepID=A0AAF1JZS2_9PROT|nr:hypothetical protein [Plastoroseomonas arctica]MBR0657547.1 hypothetical protein [Plastoroseomonas arctica]